MKGRLGKMTLTQEIELLRSLEHTIKVAIEKARLIQNSTGHQPTADKMEHSVIPNLKGDLDRVQLALFWAYEDKDAKTDELINGQNTFFRGAEEVVSLTEDMGR